MPLLDEDPGYGQRTATGIAPQLSLEEALRALAVLPDRGASLLPQPSAPAYQPIKIGPPPITFTPAAQSPTIVVDRALFLQDQQRRQQEAAQRLQEQVAAAQRIRNVIQPTIDTYSAIDRIGGTTPAVEAQYGILPNTNPLYTEEPAVDPQAAREQRIFGRTLTPTERVEMGLATPRDPFVELGQKAYQVATTEIPGAQRVADVAGQIGQRIGEHAIGAMTLPGVEYIPGVRQASHALGTATGALASSLVPTEVWQAALTLIPAAKARSIPELLSAITIGDVNAIDAIRNAGKKLGESPAVEEMLGKLASEAGASKIPGKAASEVVKPIAIPDEVRAVLRKNGVRIKPGSWEALLPVNRDLIADMAKTSVSNFDRKALLAEGRKRQAGAINAALARTDLPFAERQALASAGMKGAILPEFQGVGKNYTPERIALLTDQIDKAKATGLISGFQWKTAGDVFRELMMGGKQLEPAQKRLMGRIFGPEFEAAIPSGKQWSAWRELTGIIGVPQALMSTFDASALARQMGPLGFSHPAQYFDALKTVKRAAMSEAGATEIMHGLLAEPWMTSAPHDGAEGLSFLDLNGRLADIGGHLVEHEGQFAALNQSAASRAVEMLPWVKPSERIFNVPINVLRGKVYQKSAEAMWQSGERDPKMYKAVADVIDHSTGWSDAEIAQIAPGLNAFFSKRNFAARFEVLLDPFRQPGSLLKPSARQLAARNLVGFTASNAALLGAMVASGEIAAQTFGIPNPVHIELDPRSTDWGKGRIGNMRIDMTGGFGSILRLVARLAPLAVAKPPQIKNASGRIQDASGFDLVDTFIRGKMGPIPGVVADAFHLPGGEGFKADLTSKEGWRTLAYNNLTPLFTQDVVDAWRQEGLAGAAIAAPVSFLGGSVTSYASPTADLDNAVRKYFGGKYQYYSDVPNYERDAFDKANPDLVQATKDARAKAGFNTFDDLAAKTTAGISDLSQQFNSGKLDAKSYRDATSELLGNQAIRYADAVKAADFNQSTLTGDKKLLNDFFKALEPATDATTDKVDFDRMDELEAAFRSTLTSAQNTAIDKQLGFSSNPTYQKLKDAKKILNDTGYFDRSDAAFASWLERLQGNAFQSSAVREASKGWQSQDDLKRYLQQKLIAQGKSPNGYISDPLWSKAWQSWLEDKNSKFLHDTPEADAYAAIWGYQPYVHTTKAAAIYKQQTGLKARFPAQ